MTLHATQYLYYARGVLRKRHFLGSLSPEDSDCNIICYSPFAHSLIQQLLIHYLLSTHTGVNTEGTVVNSTGIIIALIKLVLWHGKETPHR